MADDRRVLSDGDSNPHVPEYPQTNLADAVATMRQLMRDIRGGSWFDACIGKPDDMDAAKAAVADWLDNGDKSKDVTGVIVWDPEISGYRMVACMGNSEKAIVHARFLVNCYLILPNLLDIAECCVEAEPHIRDVAVIGPRLLDAIRERDEEIEQLRAKLAAAEQGGGGGA